MILDKLNEFAECVTKIINDIELNTDKEIKSISFLPDKNNEAFIDSIEFYMSDYDFDDDFNVNYMDEGNIEVCV